MNLPNKRDRLLSDLFQNGDSSALALRAARALRRRRTARKSAMVAITLMSLGSVCFWRISQKTYALHAEPKPQVSAPAEHHRYEEISEAEALSLLRDQSVLITQEHGQTRMILLGQIDSR